MYIKQQQDSDKSQSKVKSGFIKATGILFIKRQWTSPSWLGKENISCPLLNVRNGGSVQFFVGAFPVVHVHRITSV